jgi:DNA-binding NtrC family response regulator
MIQKSYERLSAMAGEVIAETTSEGMSGKLPYPEPRKSRVMVVDDDCAVREALGKVICEAGYELVLAGDGQEALDHFRRERIDLLLLDLGLPIKSGWDVFENMTRENPALPVIIITGQPNQYNPALAAGAGALMEKPLDVPQLLRTMREMLAESPEARLRRLCGQGHDTRYLPSGNSTFLRRLREQAKTPYHFAPSDKDPARRSR